MYFSTSRAINAKAANKRNKSKPLVLYVIRWRNRNRSFLRELQEPISQYQWKRND